MSIMGYPKGDTPTPPPPPRGGGGGGARVVPRWLAHFVLRRYCITIDLSSPMFYDLINTIRIELITILQQQLCFVYIR